MQQVYRVFVEKKKGNDIEASNMLKDLRENVGITSLEELRIINRYDAQGLSEDEFKSAVNGVFSEADLEGKNPMMTYIGYHGGDTYTIEYGEIQDEAQQKEFADILNTYISNILPFFEYA